MKFMKIKDQTTDAPTVPAGTEFERFRNAVKQIISVPKEEIDKREAEYQKERSLKKVKTGPKPRI